jgi:endonuclease/exonuclease/phosphatase family metal-dependent hydrolase
MPPCGVYQTPARVNVPVTAASFALRSRQLAGFIRDTVKPDVIAFQEVSGTAAVNEALGPMASEFQTCSFDGQYKVQRLAFAWRKSVAEVVEPCRPIEAISLPALAEVDRVRPGYQVGLRIRGKLVRFLNLHLKSSCVSPLDGGQLDSTDARAEACAILQQQVRPLEAAIEQLAPGADHFVVLGDFNRNI